MFGEARSLLPPLTPARIAAVDAVLARHGLRRAPDTGVIPIADSVVNENYGVHTPEGRLFIRFVREARTREQLEAEHRAVRFAAAVGIPAAPPLPVPGGSPIVAIDGRIAVVFPWVEGETAVRGAITPATAATLGDLYGRLQAAFAGYADPALGGPGSDLAWDTARSVAELHDADRRIDVYPAPAAARRRARTWLRAQLARLESAAPQPVSAFADLPLQPDHADFHERNVILGATGTVRAVVDWERIRLRPAPFELVRSIDFMRLDGAALDAYLAAYACHRVLTRGECTRAVEQYWQATLHNTWAFTAVFVRGEARVARFLPEVEPRLRRFADPAFRRWLAGRIASHAAR